MAEAKAEERGTAAAGGPAEAAPAGGAGDGSTGKPTGPLNSLVNPLLTDMYQITMAYGYWLAGKAEDPAVFDLFFRKNPFKGEYTIFAGLEEVLKHISTFKVTKEQVAYLRKEMPDCEEGFFEYMEALDCSGLRVYAVPEGSVVFPRIPLLRVEGPLAVAQLLETTILVLCNYASLMATNATRFRRAAGDDKVLLEFGLRRAQGPDGGVSASRYAFMGGFDGTSNVLAGMLFGIGARGTMAHSFVTAYTGIEDLKSKTIKGVDVVARALALRRELGYRGCNDGELAAFVAYAQAFPKNFLALVDTYDTLHSGVPNFVCVALVLLELGYEPKGIRLDSGDLAYLSKEARAAFIDIAERYDTVAKYGFDFGKSVVVASNDINEPVLHALHDQGHAIDAFGIGTHLVTCQAQPALGMVYKLVEVNGKPRIKLSQEISKVTIPGAKEAFRLLGAENVPLLDLLIRRGETRPQAGRRLLCRHPFDEKLRVYVTPKSVIPLLVPVYVGAAALKAAAKVGGAGSAGDHDLDALPSKAGICINLPSLLELKAYVKAQLAMLREDHLRHMNPTPYKVSVSPELYHFIHDLWMKEVPIAELE